MSQLIAARAHSSFVVMVGVLPVGVGVVGTHPPTDPSPTPGVPPVSTVSTGVARPLLRDHSAIPIPAAPATSHAPRGSGPYCFPRSITRASKTETGMEHQHYGH